MTIPPQEIFDESLNKSALERFNNWLLLEKGDKKDAHKVIADLLKGTTMRAKERLVDELKESDTDKQIVYIVEALIAVDVMNQSIFARKALANAIKPEQMKKALA